MAPARKEIRRFKNYTYSWEEASFKEVEHQEAENSGKNLETKFKGLILQNREKNLT